MVLETNARGDEIFPSPLLPHHKDAPGASDSNHPARGHSSRAWASLLYFMHSFGHESCVWTLLLTFVVSLSLTSFLSLRSVLTLLAQILVSFLLSSTLLAYWWFTFRTSSQARTILFLNITLFRQYIHLHDLITFQGNATARCLQSHW